jgi:hypothetical protein
MTGCSPRTPGPPPTSATYRFCLEPGGFGGVESQLATNGTTTFAAVNNLPMPMTSTAPGYTEPSTAALLAALARATGEMVMINQDTGTIEWADRLPSSPYGAAAVTNNVVFTTTYSGDLYAFNAATGAILLKTRLPARTNARSPSTATTSSPQEASPNRLGSGCSSSPTGSGATGKLPAPRARSRPQEAEMSEPAIAVRGLRKSFGAKEAVAGIDLEIATAPSPGSSGRTGRAETTSLSMMTGLLRPDSGQVLVAKPDVWADLAAAKAVMGVNWLRPSCSSG